MRTITKCTLSLTVTGLAVILTLGIFSGHASAADDSKDQSKTVPVIDGGIGPCTADFTITDADGKPLYDAKIKVHIAYRFLNAHKLDLEVGTNADGKARFTGLPDKIKHGLYFYATQGDLQAEAFDDPVNNCKEVFALALKKKEVGKGPTSDLQPYSIGGATYGVPPGPPAILHAYIKNDVAVRSIAGSFVE